MPLMAVPGSSPGTASPRHARARRGHPRLSLQAAKTWMAGTSPAMTDVSKASIHRLPDRGIDDAARLSVPGDCPAHRMDPSGALGEAERLVDQLLPAFHLLGELLVDRLAGGDEGGLVG